MSEIKVNSIKGVAASSAAITVNNTDGTCTANITNNLSNRNLIINGAMQVAQRGTTSDVQSGYAGTDRYYQYIGGDGRATISQDTDVPTGQGFSYSTKIDVTTADSNAASNRGWWGQRIERDICQPVAKGTSNAKQLTLSFHIKSPKSGTHIVGLYDNENNRNVLQSYTVSTANTWEKITVVFPADTTGTIPNGTTYGLQVYFLLMSGSNSQASSLGTTWHTYDVAKEGQGGQNLFDSTSNNIYFTGIQLEVGSVATDFEHRSFGQELALCQRYFYMMVDASAGQQPVITATCYTDGSLFGARSFPVTMRANPSVYQVSSSAYYRAYGDVTSRTGDSVSISVASTNGCELEMSVSGTSVSRPYFIRTNDSNARIGFSAEL